MKGICQSEGGLRMELSPIRLHTRPNSVATFTCAYQAHLSEPPPQHHLPHARPRRHPHQGGAEHGEGAEGGGGGGGDVPLVGQPAVEGGGWRGGRVSSSAPWSAPTTAPWAGCTPSSPLTLSTRMSAVTLGSALLGVKEAAFLLHFLFLTILHVLLQVCIFHKFGRTIILHS